MSSLQAYGERLKRRYKDPLKKVLNAKASLKENRGEKIKEDVDVDVAKEEEGEVEEEIMTTFIIMKGVINPPKIMEKEEVETILIEQMKEEPMLKKNSILLVIKKVKSQHYY
ncbi:hypothetical protein CR513_38102, partial [Mucuna pruriens]